MNSVALNIPYIKCLLSSNIHLEINHNNIEKIASIAEQVKDFQLVELMLGNYPNIKDTIVHAAVSVSAKNLLIWLFQQNLVDVKSLSVATGLATACKVKKYNIMEMLLQQGADVCLFYLFSHLFIYLLFILFTLL